MTTIWALMLPLLMAGGDDRSTSAPKDRNREGPGVAAKGTLLVDGGGKPSLPARKKALKIAGGAKARVLVIALASNLRDMGPKSVERWREAGAENVQLLDVADPKAAVEAVRAADLIWMTGGAQERLMKRLEGIGVTEAIRDRFRDGAAVGGTSAGAAVLSDVMIARSVEEYPRPLCQYPLMGNGLGLWPGVIVDQHFSRFRRTERLNRAMSWSPGLVGVGVDESTIAIVRGRTIEVAGDGHVFVFDPRNEKDKDPVKPAVVGVKDGGGDGPAAPPAGADPADWKAVSLNPGMTFDLDRGIISDPVAETH